jgi:hypothetical protein
MSSGGVDELGFKVFVSCSGLSNLGLYNNAKHGNLTKPTSKGMALIVNILNVERDKGHGRFLHATGQRKRRD